MISQKAARIINALKMEKHCEGGYFTEEYKSSESVSIYDATLSSGEKRNLASSIYFLLSAEDVSRFHRLKSDEIWYFHAGDPIVIYIIDKEGILRQLRLGTNIEAGERPQAIIPKGSIFGALPEDNFDFCLIGCMVCPGFEYKDFELMEKKALLRLYPQHREIILRLT